MIIQVVSEKRDCGKTKLVEYILQEARKRGFKTVVIKHTHEFIEKENKDSDRYSKAGADRILLVQPDNRIIEIHKEEKIEDFFADGALVIIEGFKNKKFGIKIKCVSSEHEISGDADYFVSLSKIDGAKLISEDFVKELLNKISIEDFFASVHVDGKKIPLNKFTQKVLRDLIIAYLSNLKGVPEKGDITIKIRR